MGTIVSRGNTFRAVVRIAGVTKTKSFDERKAAKIWILQTEAGLIDGPRVSKDLTLGFVFEKARQRDLEKPYKSAGPALFARLSKEIGDTPLKDCDEDFWFATVKGWKILPYSRLTLLQRIRGALSFASAAHGVKIDRAALDAAQARLTHVKIIGEGIGRERRVTNEEIARLKAAAAEMETEYPHADLIDFAIDSCMRAAEICRITWADLNTERGKPMVWIRDRKDPKHKLGNDQNVPLLGRTAAIIARQKKKTFWDGSEDERIFPFAVNAVGNSFRRLKARAKIKNLHFHDLRHEGISRLFEMGYGPAEVCKVSGHKDWNTLGIYTHLSAPSMHDGPISLQQARRAAA